MNKTANILEASVHGTVAFNAGKPSAPCQDSGIMAMVGRPDVVASTVEILDAWAKAWHAANLHA
jgi:hypothetical protein